MFKKPIGSETRFEGIELRPEFGEIGFGLIDLSGNRGEFVQLLAKAALGDGTLGTCDGFATTLGGSDATGILQPAGNRQLGDAIFLGSSALTAAAILGVVLLNEAKNLVLFFGGVSFALGGFLGGCAHRARKLIHVEPDTSENLNFV
jgi:hypothetical protein